MRRNAVIVLIHKKGYTSDIKKLQTNQLAFQHVQGALQTFFYDRIIRKLDFHQPLEQAGFRDRLFHHSPPNRK